MIKRSIAYSNLKNGTSLTQLDLAKHLEKEGLGKEGSLQVTFSALNSGKQKGGSYALLAGIAKFLKISADSVLKYYSEVNK